ncbi:tail fiber domain-containing protein [Streptomyces sp. ISL-11]|uniref:tail fiber domain-containing protein n=1 Tax=Streptomyces sp. ISL-11 TaxID=2819174 RepID=UPI001BE9C153|nr:tail fiber domain-containing protein [Streptomyces sp. ISL-11]MBT2386625.1 tail fiber domain-containing protein [Streptomyces sp. ISL-11]
MRKRTRRDSRLGAGLASGAVPETVAGDSPGAVNGFALLEKVTTLPVSTWRYTWDEPHVRHLGPMAQDWWAAFGLGGSDTTISCTDANGVALVAIQALHRRLTDLQCQVGKLAEQLNKLAADSPDRP